MFQSDKVRTLHRILTQIQRKFEFRIFFVSRSCTIVWQEVQFVVYVIVVFILVSFKSWVRFNPDNPILLYMILWGIEQKSSIDDFRCFMTVSCTDWRRQWHDFVSDLFESRKDEGNPKSRNVKHVVLESIRARDQLSVVIHWFWNDFANFQDLIDDGDYTSRQPIIHTIDWSIEFWSDELHTETSIPYSTWIWIIEMTWIVSEKTSSIPYVTGSVL